MLFCEYGHGIKYTVPARKRNQLTCEKCRDLWGFHLPHIIAIEQLIAAI